MAYSIYEVNDYQDTPKPGDQVQEDNLTQDVFVQTRPELYDFDKSDGGGNPYFDFSREDQSIKNQEWGDKPPNSNSQNWDKQEPYLKNTVKRVTYSYQKGLYLPHEQQITLDSFKESPKSNELTKTAASMAYLLGYTSDFSKKNYPKTKAFLVSEDRENKTWTYKVKGYEKKSDPHGHLVNVRLGKMPNQKQKKFNILNLPIHVSCDCKFWKYWGPDYNSGRAKSYLLGPHKSDGSAPNIRDPKRVNLICKHVYTVGLILKRFAIQHKLDNSEQIDKILNFLKDDKQLTLPDIGMESIEQIVGYLESSDKKIIQPLITKFHSQKDESKKEQLKDEAIEQLRNLLENKDKLFLEMLMSKLKTHFTNIFEKVKRDKKVVDFKKEVDDKEVKKEEVKKEKTKKDLSDSIEQLKLKLKSGPDLTKSVDKDIRDLEKKVRVVKEPSLKKQLDNLKKLRKLKKVKKSSNEYNVKRVVSLYLEAREKYEI